MIKNEFEEEFSYLWENKFRNFCLVKVREEYQIYNMHQGSRIIIEDPLIKADVVMKMKASPHVVEYSRVEDVPFPEKPSVQTISEFLAKSRNPYFHMDITSLSSMYDAAKKLALEAMERRYPNVDEIGERYRLIDSAISSKIGKPILYPIDDIWHLKQTTRAKEFLIYFIPITPEYDEVEKHFILADFNIPQKEYDNYLKYKSQFANLDFRVKLIIHPSCEIQPEIKKKYEEVGIACSSILRIENYGD
jgi:hypothetical protein